MKALWLRQSLAHRSERSTDAARERVSWAERLSTREEVGEARRGGQGRAEDAAQIWHRSVPSFIF